jgi:Ser-tRNA(Ala) deacylase AlaX
MQDRKLAKLLVGAPATNELRVIEVNIFNKQICYGTHVNRTKEIGKISLVDSSNKRVYFKVE